MRSWSPGRSAILRAGVVFTLLAVWVFAPSTASASCGDYVTSLAQRLAHGEHGGRRMPGPASPTDSRLTPGYPARDRLPCSGPTCSQRPTVPDAPLPTVTSHTEPWCDTTRVPRFQRPEPFADPHDSFLNWPTRRDATPSRPPRPTLLITHS